MPRRKTDLVAGEFYHVYNRGCDRRPIFFERENYFHLVKLMKGKLHAHLVEVIAWCLMPNHFHLLLRPENDALPSAMQEFGTSYTKSINRWIGRTGTLFEGRFKAIHVSSEEYLLHLTRYLHLNPVKAGLVAMPDEWEFSSYVDYLGLRHGTLANPARILQLFGSVDSYRQFVEAGIGAHDSLIEHLTGPDDE